MRENDPLFSVKNCDLDLKHQNNRLYANTNMLLRNFLKCSPDVKCYLLETYCCSLYYAPFWYDSTKTAMKNLKVAYNNSLRRLLGLPSHNSASSMFVNLNIPSFEELLRKYMLYSRNRLETSELFVEFICIIFHFSLAYRIGGVTLARASFCVYYCILSIFLILIFIKFIYFVKFYIDCYSEINN